MGIYTQQELFSIYELGRLYFEMGFYVPAERIFSGLSVVDQNLTPARVGLGVLKLERGLFQESAVHFRAAIQSNAFLLEAKLGLVAAFTGMGELPRARSLLSEVAKEFRETNEVSSELVALAEVFATRCAS